MPKLDELFFDLRPDPVEELTAQTAKRVAESRALIERAQRALQRSMAVLEEARRVAPPGAPLQARAPDPGEDGLIRWSGEIRGPASRSASRRRLS